jgi:hypothetical protein
MGPSDQNNLVVENVNLRYLEAYGAKALADGMERRNDLAALLLKWDVADEKRLDNMVISIHIDSDSDTRSSEDQAKAAFERKNEVGAWLEKWDEADVDRLQSMLKSPQFDGDGILRYLVPIPQIQTHKAAQGHEEDAPSEEKDAEPPRRDHTVYVQKGRLASVRKKQVVVSKKGEDTSEQSQSSEQSSDYSSDQDRGQIGQQKPESIQDDHTVTRKLLSTGASTYEKNLQLRLQTSTNQPRESAKRISLVRK